MTQISCVTISFNALTAWRSSVLVTRCFLTNHVLLDIPEKLTQYLLHTGQLWQLAMVLVQQLTVLATSVGLLLDKGAYTVTVILVHHAIQHIRIAQCCYSSVSYIK